MQRNKFDPQWNDVYDEWSRKKSPSLHLNLNKAATIAWLNSNFYVLLPQTTLEHSIYRWRKVGIDIDGKGINTVLELLNHYYYDGQLYFREPTPSRQSTGEYGGLMGGESARALPVNDGSLNFESPSLVSSCRPLPWFENSNALLTPYDWWDAFWNFVNPRALFYQLNLLEVTAGFTLIWEINLRWRPIVSPDHIALYVGLGLLTVAMVRNNYNYTIASRLSGDQIRALEDMREQALKDIFNHHPAFHALFNKRGYGSTSESNEDAKQKALDALTCPTAARRWLNEYCAFSSVAIKGTAIFAALWLMLGDDDMPLAMKLVLLTAAAAFEAFDTAFNKVVGIGLWLYRLMMIRNGIVPPAQTKYFAPGISWVADIGVLAWGMAKAGPSAWLVTKIVGAARLFDLVGLRGDQVPGGLYGTYLILLLSALLGANVFSVFNVGVKLAHELPTDRGHFNYLPVPGVKNKLIGTLVFSVYIVPAVATGFGLAALDWPVVAQLIVPQLVGACFGGVTNKCAPDQWQRSSQGVAQAVVGALPVVAAVTYSAARLGNVTDAIVAGITVLSAGSLLLMSGHERAIAWYRYFMEFEFVEPMFRGFDRLALTDKLALTAVSGAATAIGCVYDEPVSAASGQVGLFLGLTSLWAGRFSRAFANKVRFNLAFTGLNAAIVLTWILYFFISIDDLRHGRDLPTGERDINYYGKDEALLLTFVSVFVGWFASSAEWLATARHVPEFIGPIQPDNVRKRSIVTAGLERLGLLCACCDSEKEKGLDRRDFMSDKRLTGSSSMGDRDSVRGIPAEFIAHF